MAAKNKPKAGNTANTKGKKRRQFLPQNKSVKKKGVYPLRRGVHGFLITCDGGRERQASQEDIYVVDSLYEELVNGKGFVVNSARIPNKPLYKKILFASSSSDVDVDDNDDGEEEEEAVEEEEKEEGREDGKGPGKQSYTCGDDDASHEKLTDKKSDRHDSDNVCCGKEMEGVTGENREDGKKHGSQAKETEEPPAEKHCREADASKCVINDKVEEKSIDELIEYELKKLGDKNKRCFVNIDSGCNGVALVQMRKRDGDPGLKDIVQHMMTSVASTRKPVSRSILRVLPIEFSCYASEEEISKAFKPLVEQYFPVETQNPQKFAVFYEARAKYWYRHDEDNKFSCKICSAPHKVDLSNPDKTIVVEIIKTVCMIGVVEKYKELAKFNLRQLTSPK